MDSGNLGTCNSVFFERKVIVENLTYRKEKIFGKKTPPKTNEYVFFRTDSLYKKLIFLFDDL